MLKKTRLSLLIALTICLNILIYLRAVATIEKTDLIFAECARNSGRTSAALNLIILLMVGFIGLKTIYKAVNKKNILRILMTLFAVNHLIHFFFVFQNFKSQFVVLDISHNIHGFITFILLLVFPIILWTFKDLTKLLYFSLILHLFNITYFMSETFYSRVKPEDTAYLHQIGILIMILALISILYRMYREKSSPFENR